MMLVKIYWNKVKIWPINFFPIALCIGNLTRENPFFTKETASFKIGQKIFWYLGLNPKAFLIKKRGFDSICKSFAWKWFLLAQNNSFHC